MTQRKWFSRRPLVRAALILVALFGGGALLLYFQIDRDLVAIYLVIAGVATKALALLTGLLAAVPIIGPLLAQVLTLPFLLVVNGLAYVVTFIAIRRGETMDAFRARVIAWGVLVGFILGVLVGRHI